MRFSERASLCRRCGSAHVRWRLVMPPFLLKERPASERSSLHALSIALARLLAVRSYPSIAAEYREIWLEANCLVIQKAHLPEKGNRVTPARSKRQMEVFCAWTR